MSLDRLTNAGILLLDPRSQIHVDHEQDCAGYHDVFLPVEDVNYSESTLANTCRMSSPECMD